MAKDEADEAVDEINGGVLAELVRLINEVWTEVEYLEDGLEMVIRSLELGDEEVAVDEVVQGE